MKKMELIRFHLGILFAVFSLHVTAQNHHYHFNNGDANDYIGTFHGVESGTGITYISGPKNYANISPSTGVLSFPSELNDSLLSRNTLDLEFDLRMTGGNHVCILSSQSNNSSAFWQDPGFSIYALIGTDAVLRFTYGDSTAYEQISMTGISLDEWHKVQITMDLNTNNFKFTVDTVTQVVSAFAGFNAPQFINSVKSSVFTIGGTNGSSINPWTGDFGLDELKITYPSVSGQSDVIAAYTALTNDLTGASPLTEAEKNTHWGTIELGLAFTNYDEVASTILNYTTTYENLNPPLFINNGLQGTYILEKDMPTHDQVVLHTQKHIFDTRFNAQHIESVKGIKFEFGELFPGVVADTVTRIIGGSVEINGTYNIDIAAAYGMQDFVVRPTGFYLAAGDTVTIEVPASITSSGLSIIVGAHFRNMDFLVADKLTGTARPRDISLEFPIASTKTKVANPYGGGIYIKIPDGSNLGWFNITVNHAVKSPYFSWRKGRESNVANFISEMTSTGAPWADFESDKYMFTIPIEDALKTSVPDKVMARWDSIMDAFRIAGGRPTETRIRAEYYTADRKLVTPSYGSGYPTVIPLAEFQRENSEWNPLTVLDFTPSTILLHEMGHTAQHPTLNYGAGYECEIEAENIIHVPIVFVNEYVYKMAKDSAFAWSGYNNGYIGYNEAAFDWIISNNFRNNLSMGKDPTVPMADKDQMNYQPRAWAKYADIARLYGWDTLSLVFGKYYTPGVPQYARVPCTNVINSAERNEFIQYASEVTGENMAPLFHFWGIIPHDTLVTALSSLPKSKRVKQLIENYACHVAPQNLAEYTVYHNNMYPGLDYQKPRYDEYLANFDATYVNAINAQFNFILNKYGLNGPNAPTNLSATTSQQVVNLTWSDNSSDESGFIVRYRTAGSTNYSVLVTTNANSTSYSTPPLPLGNYEFVVTAVNGEQLESNSCGITPVAVALGTCESHHSFSVSSCGNYTSPSGKVWSTSGIRNDTLVAANQAGCDSILTINLTVNQPINHTDIRNVCGSYTWIDGVTYSENNSTATFTYPNGAANGCDSIVSLHLTIGHPATYTDVQNACGSYTWIDGITYTNNNSTATFTYPGGAANGCDSVVTLNLTIGSQVDYTDIQNSCGEFTWIDGITYSDDNTTATFTYPGGAASGCDSVVTLNLTIYVPTESIDIREECSPFVWIDGKTYTASTDSAQHVYVNGGSNGCDSTVILDLTIIPVETGVFVFGNELEAVEIDATSFQWVDCNNGYAPIQDQTEEVFLAENSGSYAVIIEMDGCKDTSSCQQIVITETFGGTNKIQVTNYPQPMQDNVIISFPHLVNEGRLLLKTMDGKELLNHHFSHQKQINLDVSTIESGSYILHIFMDKELMRSLKLVK